MPTPTAAKPKSANASPHPILSRLRRARAQESSDLPQLTPNPTLPAARRRLALALNRFRPGASLPRLPTLNRKRLLCSPFGCPCHGRAAPIVGSAALPFCRVRGFRGSAQRMARGSARLGLKSSPFQTLVGAGRTGEISPKTDNQLERVSGRKPKCLKWKLVAYLSTLTTAS